MKIVEQSSDRLVLQLRPWIIWIFSALFIGFGLVPIFSTSKRELICDRTPTPGQCELHSHQLFSSSKLNTFQLSAVQRARLESKRDSEGDSLYRVVLLTDQGSVPFTSIYSSGRSQYRHYVAVINAFLQNPEQRSLYVEYNDHWSLLIVTLISSGTGIVLLVFMGEIVTCDFDRLSGTLHIARRGLFGTRTQKHSLDEVSDVVVRASPGSDGGGTYRICFIFREEEVPVTAYYSTGRKEKWKTVELIRQFLPIVKS